MDTTTTMVFVVVIGGRFLLPLLIPYYPLPAVVASLILDGVDQTIFQPSGTTPRTTGATTRRWTSSTCPSPTLVRPRLAPPDWSWKFRPEPLPEAIDEPEEQAAWRMRFDAILSFGTLEKVMLVGLVSVIFAEILPDFTGSTLDVFIGVSAVVVINSGITLAAARRRWTIRSTALAFAVRLAMNIALVLIADPLLGRHNARLDGYDTLFFLTLISLITTLHDRWRPVHEVRQVLSRREPAPVLDVERD